MAGGIGEPALRRIDGQRAIVSSLLFRPTDQGEMQFHMHAILRMLFTAQTAHAIQPQHPLHVGFRTPIFGETDFPLHL